MVNSILEWTKQNLWKTALYGLYGIWSAMEYGIRQTPFKFFKRCLPQILLGSFLKIFSHM